MEDIYVFSATVAYVYKAEEGPLKGQRVESQVSR